MKILVVDDDPVTLRTFHDALDEAGFDVVAADSGGRALTAARVANPDGIVADLRLPDMSALDFLTECRRDQIDTPFVVVTAFGSICDAVEAMKLGAADFVQKPIPTNDLVQIVRQALSPGPALTARAIERQSITDRRVIRALEIIDERYRDQSLQLSSVAGEVDVSRFYLARLLKRETGRTFRHHVQVRRILASEALLTTTNLRMKEIASRVGYESTGWFDRWFAYFHGEPPSEFRRRHARTP